MKTVTNLFLIFILLVSPLANAGWVNTDGVDVADTDDMKSSGDFISRLIITDQGDDAFKELGTPARGVAFQNSDTIKRNSPLTVAIAFAGCKANAKGNCYLLMQVTITQPDGEIYAKLPVTEMWFGKPVPEQGRLEVGSNVIQVVVENEEPIGKYRIDAKVMDKMSGQKLLLNSSFTAIE